jgi:hypothetical protein
VDHALRQRDADAGAAQFIPGVRADGVEDVVLPGVLLDPDLDLVDHRAVAELLEEHLRGGVLQHAVHVGGGAQQDAADLVGRGVIVHRDGEAHGVVRRGIAEVLEMAVDEVNVRDFQIGVVNRAQPRGAPVEFHHLGQPAVNVEPVALLEGLAHLDGQAGDEVRDHRAQRETDGDTAARQAGEDARDALVEDELQDQHHRHRQAHEPGGVHEEARHHAHVALLLEVALPIQPVEQRQQQQRVQHHHRGQQEAALLPGNVHEVERRQQAVGDGDEMERRPHPHPKPGAQLAAQIKHRQIDRDEQKDRW